MLDSWTLERQETLEDVDQTQEFIAERGCGISILRDISNSTGYEPKQVILGDAASRMTSLPSSLLNSFTPQG